MKLGLILAALLVAAPLAAQELNKSKSGNRILKKHQSAPTWYEPERGTAERKALMNALRPLAEAELGAPVEFVVNDLRVSGDRAYTYVSPQRPGGREIDLAETPGYIRGDLTYENMNGVEMQALYVRSGDTWVVMDHAIGAMDVWFAGEPYCSNWGPVIAEFCY